LRRGIDHLGIFGGEFPPDIGITGLYEDRIALRAARNIEERVQLVIFAVVMDRMGVRRVEIGACFAIGMVEGAVLPTIP
jgi:hypothetical protein